MSVSLIGCVDHPLYQACRDALETHDLTPIYDINIVHLCVDQELTASTLYQTRQQVFDVLRYASSFPNQKVKYVHVKCHGSVADENMVQLFRDEFGVHACVVDLGVLFHNGASKLLQSVIEDISSDRAVVISDTKETISFCDLKSAVRSILAVLASDELGGSNRVRVSLYDHPMPVSSFVTAVARAHNPNGRVHLKFCSESEEDVITC